MKKKIMAVLATIAAVLGFGFATIALIGDTCMANNREIFSATRRRATRILICTRRQN